MSNDALVPAISTAQISKAFGTRTALDKVSFDVPQGAFLSIFGSNGAGKTTLLRVLATLSRATSGSASVLGIDLKAKPEDAREHIGLVSHKPMLYPDLTVEENLRFAADLYGVVDADARVSELLDEVELAPRRLSKVRTLSRGMTQRLSIARAFVHDPALMLLDEPYAGLDPRAVEIFDGIIAAQRAECAERAERTFCMVSHDLEKGFDLCTHALILARGRVVFFGEKNDIDFAEFSQIYAKNVGTGVA